MTLASSGSMDLKGSVVDVTRSIEYECEGAISGDFSLTTAQGLASAYVGSLPTSLTDFYGFELCTESVPDTPGVFASWSATNLINLEFFKDANVDWVNFQHSADNSTWYTQASGYSGSSPYTGYADCSFLYYRINGENCAGVSSWSTSRYAGNCP